MTQQLPVPGGQVLDMDGLLGKLTHKGLRWYRSSDEFTRAVAYEAASLRFKDAARRYTTGILGKGDEAAEKFIELAGLGFEPPAIRNQARALIQRGEWGAAEQMFASRVVDETMFVYRAGGSPIAYRGLIGTIFGMFGTYPAYYVENIRRALKYTTTAQKLAYAAKFTANSMLFYSAFRAMGINASNFLPWIPATFSGGPIYNMMNQALAAMDFRSYKGRQARAELIGITRRDGRLYWEPGRSEIGKFLPTFAVRSFFRGIEMANDGDFYGAFLTVTGFPYSQELLEGMV